MDNNWKSVNIQYDKKHNRLIFPISSKEVLPTFLHYLLLNHNLPQDATIVFNDQVVKLIKVDQEYIYRRI